MRSIGLFTLVAWGFVLASCHTVPSEIPPDLSQAELIQLAQAAADQENWAAAIAYYTAIIDRFPQDRASTAVARYEIAFIKLQRGDTAAAEAGFQELLGMYDFEAQLLPPWPRVLALRLLEDIAGEAEGS